MKIFLKIFLGLLVIIGFVMSATLLVWIKPDLILTDSRVNRLFDQYAGSYFSKRPENLKLFLSPHSFFGKEVRIEASDFCLKEPDSCFKNLNIGFSFVFHSFTKIKVVSIGPLIIENKYLNYPIKSGPEALKPTPDSSSSSTFFDHVVIPTHLVLKNIHIDFPKIVVTDHKEIIQGAVSASGKESGQILLTAVAKSNEGLEGSLRIQSSSVFDHSNPFFAKVHFKKQGTIDGELKGAMEWEKLEGKLEGDLALQNFIPWIHTLYLRNFRLEHKDKIKISADLETKLDQKLSFDHSKSVLPKVNLSSTIKGKIEATEDQGSTHYKIQIGPTLEKGLSLECLGSGVYPFPKGQEYQYGIDHFFLGLDIPVFQDLVQSLKRTNYAVPAPFSTLMGKISLKIGQESGEIANNTLPMTLVSDLKSKEQAIKTQSRAEIVFAPPPKKMKISGESNIELFRLTLPDLKTLEPTPLVKNDPRLISGEHKITPKKTAHEKELDSPIELSWKIKTAPSGIQIYHSILKPYAPIEVNWTIGEVSEGSIDFKPFEIEYLKRKARVESLRFYQKPGDTQTRYQGKLEISKTDFTIYVSIVEEGEKPKIVLTSDPPLAESDIISVLLFNQTSSQLDTDQTSSVASTQSAVANRALGLFSILALSSTPVEAVNYNSATGVYSVRVKLANGLTATVGTDWDKTQEVALRKRLGKNFILSTILQSDPGTNSETRKTLIEWFRRF